MKVFLIHNGKRTRVTTLHAGADHALLDGPCPGCGAPSPKLRGHGKHIANDDRAYEATAEALCCGLVVGTLRAEMPTLFGLAEDEAVCVDGRARVYGGTVRR